MNLSKSIQHKAFDIISRASEEVGYETYVVGGYVRDIFLKRESKDIDIVAVGSGIELAKKVAELLGEKTKISVFKNFGTAMLHINDLEIEFVGARKESYSRDSRKPVVEDGTLHDDQLRRDFTVNALAISLNKDHYGKLLDPFNGYEHIQQRIIKTPREPGRTFSDDPLRMMRAVRFATQLDFTIEEETYQALIKNAERLKIVSHERIVDEMNKIIMAEVPSKGFKLLFNTGLLQQFFPELANLEGVDKAHSQKHKDNFYHTIEVLDNVAAQGGHLWLRWAAILHDIAKPATKRYDPSTGFTFHGHEALGSKMIPGIFKRLKLPLNDKMKYVQKLVFLHLRPIALIEEGVTDSAVRRLLFEAGNDIEDLMVLCKADITSKNRNKVIRYRQNFDAVKKKLEEVEENDRIRNWQPPVSGEFIMRTFGIKPSKEVGIIKNAIREAILDGHIGNNFQEAQDFMLEKAKELGLKPVSEDQKNTHGND
ncbi:MAG: CCA tRNA nucleotidyltransferase [Bacteroidales bacterium]|nr:CCA tRNA nucleotidyltransferase [Bacteroidales bacterium]